MVSPPARQIWLLGGLRVAARGQSLSVPGGKAQSLLAFLALNGWQSHPRELLIECFWPESPPSQGRRRLTDALYRLNQSLVDQWIEADRDQIALSTDPELWIDVFEFRRLLAHDDSAAVEAALELYRGDLLPELYEDWTHSPREALRASYLQALETLAAQRERDDRPAAALALYRRLVQVDPLQEAAWQAIIRLQAASGQLVEALATFDRLAGLLDAELGVIPSPHTRALASEVRAELVRQRAQVERATPYVMHPPFVGRLAERGQLLARLDQARAGRGGIVTLIGEAGIGKSRLLGEIAQAAGWRGWHVALGQSEPLTLPAPYTPLRQALQEALPRPRRQQVAQLVRPVWLAALSGLITDFQDAAEPLSQAGSVDLATALARLLRGLQQIAPHLLVLEDVHWADPAIWPLLEALREELASQSVLLLLSARPDDLRGVSDAWSMLESWDRAGEIVMQLPGLNPSDLRELATHLRVEGRTAQQAQQLSVASGGNPLLALALLQAESVESDRTVPSLKELTEQRLARLPDEARQALQVAAVIGYRFDYAIWQALLDAEKAAATLPFVAGRLERDGLISLDAEGYRFVHDTLRGVVYEQMELAERQRWHARALEVLSGGPVGGAHAPQTVRSGDPFALLYHAEQARDWSSVSSHALEAGRAALASYTMSAAVDYFSMALRWLPENDLYGQYAARLGRVQALNVLGERSQQASDLDHLRSLAELMGDRARQAEAALHLANYYWTTGDYDRAREATESGLALARQAGEPLREAELLTMKGRVERENGHYVEAREAASRARELYQQLGNRVGEVNTTDLLGGLAWQIGDYPSAARLHAASAEMFRDLGDILREAQSLNRLGSALWGLGDYLRAREVHQRALAVCRELGDRRSEADNLDNMGGVAWVLGDYSLAIELYSSALAIRRDISDTWGVSISLGNLGSAHRLKDEPEQALLYYEEALRVNRDMGRRRGEGYALHGRGMTLLEMGRLPEAREALLGAHEIRVELRERDNLIETNAGLSLLCLAEGRVDDARVAIVEALEAVESHDRPTLRLIVCYSAYEVARARDESEESLRHLREAHAAMLETAATLPPDDRARFLARVPINQQVHRALAANASTRKVAIVREGVPLGRRLAPEDYRTITWTIASPEDDNIPNKSERRQHILKRLLQEAGNQGAVPTDDDLASALQVSRRTILRDMAALERAGHLPQTRRRTD